MIVIRLISGIGVRGSLKLLFEGFTRDAVELCAALVLDLCLSACGRVDIELDETSALVPLGNVSRYARAFPTRDWAKLLGSNFAIRTGNIGEAKTPFSCCGVRDSEKVDIAEFRGLKSVLDTPSMSPLSG